MADTAPNNQRRNIYIDKDFQNNFIFRFSMLVALGAVVTIGFIYIFAQQSTTVSILSGKVVVRSTSDFILPVLIQTVLVVTAVVGSATALMMVYVSHKIAGPVYRFNQTLKELTQGNFSKDIHLRQLDQLKELADSFNGMITANRGQIQAVKAALKQAKEKAQGSDMAVVQESLEELEQKLTFFKI